MSTSASSLRVSWIVFACAVATALPSLADGPLHYYTLPPCRLVDTRKPNSPTGGPKFAAGQERAFKVQGSACSVPPGAKAVLLNVTVAEGAAGGGFLKLYPSGIGQPEPSNINFAAIDTIANGATVALADSASFPDDMKVYASNGVHVILDVTGYFR